MPDEDYDHQVMEEIAGYETSDLQYDLADAMYYVTTYKWELSTEDPLKQLIRVYTAELKHRGEKVPTNVRRVFDPYAHDGWKVEYDLE